MAEVQFDSEVLEAIPSIDAVDPSLRQQCTMAAMDVAETLVFARQLETISNRVFNIQYPDLKAARLVPRNTEAGPADEYLTFRVWDHYTMAKIVGNYSTDIPLVNASAREVTTKFFTVANGYTYSVDDLRAAQRAGVQLQSRFAEAARRGIELAREEVASVGSPEIGTFGLANQPNATIATLPNGNWAAATAEEIREDLNYLMDTMILGSNEILSPNTILLPTSLYRIAQRKLISIGGVVGGMTALQMFAGQNAGITVESWNKLETAGADGGPRIVVYQRDPSVLEFIDAIPLETMPTEYRAMQWTTVLRSRMGGVVLYQPAGLVYADNA
jgi:hypothetical protein